MSHTCHAMNCDATVPPRKHMCARHWAMVPRVLQDALWAEYRPGQERRKDPTPAYLIAAKRCVLAVAVLEGVITQEQADENLASFERHASRAAQLMGLGASVANQDEVHARRRAAAAGALDGPGELR